MASRSVALLSLDLRVVVEDLRSGLPVERVSDLSPAGQRSADTARMLETGPLIRETSGTLETTITS